LRRREEAQGAKVAKNCGNGGVGVFFWGEGLPPSALNLYRRGGEPWRTGTKSDLREDLLARKLAKEREGGEGRRTSTSGEANFFCKQEKKGG